MACAEQETSRANTQILPIKGGRRDRLKPIMASNEPTFGKQTARVLSFRRGATRATNGLPPAVRDLAKYERAPADRGEVAGEYRHRMMVNAAALLFVIALIVAGLWIADTMARMRKNQDCVLSGRRGCTPVDVAPNDRW
jgi:hypothetical protein